MAFETISKREGLRAAAALERVRSAGRIAKREAKQRVGMIGGAVATGALGWAEGTGRWDGKAGPLHISLIGIPMAFATSMMGSGALARQLESAAGPLLGVATYKMGKGETVLGDEYGGSSTSQYG